MGTGREQVRVGMGVERKLLMRVGDWLPLALPHWKHPPSPLPHTATGKSLA